MLKALFKKQMLEMSLGAFYKQKKVVKKNVLTYALMYLFSFGIFFFLFGSLSSAICKPLVLLNLDWLYFGVETIIAFILGTFACTFSVSTSLYGAKDNELLLSFPIPSKYILVIRLLSLWIWDLLYVFLVLGPALGVYWEVKGSTFANVTLGLMLPILLSIFELTLSCTIGFGVSKIGSKFKSKNSQAFMKVFLSLLFMVIYYCIFFNFSLLKDSFLNNAESFERSIKGNAYPLYLIGRIGEGDFLSFAIIAAVVLVLFIVTFVILSHSFLKMATTKAVITKKVYREKEVNCKTTSSALLLKEIKRFLSSYVYILNCGMGTVFFIAISIFLIFKSDFIANSFLGEIPWEKILLMVCAGFCFICSYNSITTPSISLEGKNIWITKSLPISPWEVLKSKIKLHFLFTEIPAFICSICIFTTLHVNPILSVVVAIFSSVFILFEACLGLILNLKRPKLDWKNEAVPVKQNLNMLISMFGGIVLIILFGVVYAFWLANFLQPLAYLVLCGILISLLTVWEIYWLKNKGTEIFKAL